MWMEKTFITKYDQTTEPQTFNHCLKDTHDNTGDTGRKCPNNQLCDLLKCLLFRNAPQKSTDW